LFSIHIYKHHTAWNLLYDYVGIFAPSLTSTGFRLNSSSLFCDYAWKLLFPLYGEGLAPGTWLDESNQVFLVDTAILFPFWEVVLMFKTRKSNQGSFGMQYPKVW